jgi:hypothetical protein
MNGGTGAGGRTEQTYVESLFLAHLGGGIEWAAGAVRFARAAASATGSSSTA